MQSILTCKNVHKYFADKQVLKGIDFSINRGEIFGLLGCNGVGKSTLIRCILKLLHTSHGEIYFQEKLIEHSDIEKYCGFLPEKFLPYGNISALELLKSLAWAHNISRKKIEELLEKLELLEHKNVRIKKYSRGMIQRLGLAMCFLKNPLFVILDEPTLGLDIVGQQKIILFLQELNERGSTIFFTSHIFPQVEKLCHRIAVLCEGQLSFIGHTSTLCKKHHSATLEDAFLHEIRGSAKKVS